MSNILKDNPTLPQPIDLENPGAISEEIRARVAKIIDEMNLVIQGRASVIHGTWVGRIAQLHVIMRGPGGTGKSLLSRNMIEHIEGAEPFEVAFDETTDPSQVLGSPDLKAMAETGRTRRVVDGMLPTATDAFCDEFFNANIPLLHAVMPPLNERLYHEDGVAYKIPLRQALMGTNKFNLDPDLHALFDRVHIRFDVNYLAEREKRQQMVSMAIARLAAAGRGGVTDLNDNKTTVTLHELDVAHKESLHLDVPDNVWNMYFDILEELGENGIKVSDRRIGDGMNAVLANAWLRGHESVKIGDMDILSNMFWTTDEDIPTARKVILTQTAPGDARAMQLLDDLDELKKKVREASPENGGDPEKFRRVCVEMIRNSEVIYQEALAERANVEAAGGSTARLQEVVDKADAFKAETGSIAFGLSRDDLQRMGV